MKLLNCLALATSLSLGPADARAPVELGRASEPPLMPLLPSLKRWVSKLCTKRSPAKEMEVDAERGIVISDPVLLSTATSELLSL